MRLKNGISIISSTDLNIFSKVFFSNANTTTLGRQGDSLLLGIYSGDIYYFDSYYYTFLKNYILKKLNIL
jgi:hypothetical protein